MTITRPQAIVQAMHHDQAADRAQQPLVVICGRTLSAADLYSVPIGRLLSHVAAGEATWYERPAAEVAGPSRELEREGT